MRDRNVDTGRCAHVAHRLCGSCNFTAVKPSDLATGDALTGIDAVELVRKLDRFLSAMIDGLNRAWSAEIAYIPLEAAARA